MKKLDKFKSSISEQAVLDNNLLGKLNGGIGGNPKLTFSSCFETTCSGDNADQYYEFLDDNGNYLIQETVVLEDTICIDRLLN